MTWWEIIRWVGVFFIGAYAGSIYEMSRIITAARVGKLLSYRGKDYRVSEVLPP